MESLCPQQDLKSALQASQIWWADMGIEVPILPVARPKKRAAPQQGTQKSLAPKQTRQKPVLAKPPEPERAGLKEQIAKATALAQAAPTLDALKTAIENFDAGLLSDHAHKMVFARGNPHADIMIIGEAPGKQEDISGEPFIGEAGQLLDKMFAAINMDAQNLYITNVCNWRPPHDRDPSEDELALCKPFITRHIALCAPKLIVLVGGISLAALAGKTSIMKNRGQWQELDIAGTTIPAMPLYHPSFLLRKPELKKFAWRDLLAIKARIESGEH